jgi:pilus assembly protein CpaE
VVSTGVAALVLNNELPETFIHTCPELSEEEKPVSRAISLVVIGRSLSQQERACLRSASQTPLSIVAELPGAPQAVEEVQRLHPQAALVILNGDLTHNLQLVEQLRLEAPETLIVCSSENASSEVILQSFRSGAIEFLRQPLQEAEVGAVLAKIEQTRVLSTGELHLSRVIAVYASKGGCGTTFVTANLAASMARLSRKRACVVDLNLQAGDQPLYLGLEPTYSIHDVVRNYDRLDDQLLASYLTHRTPSVSLLAAPTEVGRDEDIQADHITRIISMLRSQFDYIILDPQHTLSEVTITALDAADDLLLLLTLDIPSIRSAKRALDIFSRLGYDPKRIKVVLNRYTKIPEFEIGQIEKVLETPVFAILSNDYPSAIASINVGEPLVQSKVQSRLAREFVTLASRLSGIKAPEEAPAPSRGGWSIFGKR